MSRCGKTHLLERAVLGEVPDEALREHAEQCPRCRHELAWLDTEVRLFRERAARDEVQHLWRGVAARTVTPARRPGLSRVLVGLAAGLLVVLGVGRVFMHAPASSSGRDASIIADSAALEALMTENAFTAADEDRCSRPGQGIGFHCGYVPASVLASR
jgi:anti-sigma factor RsiW